MVESRQAKEPSANEDVDIINLLVQAHWFEIQGANPQVGHAMSVIGSG
jgi:hypothetical protein